MTGHHEHQKNGPGFVEVLNALKRTLKNNPRIWHLPRDEVARQLILGGYLSEEPSLSVVTDARATVEAEEQAFGPDVPTEDA
jgi:hypothetical protein